MVGSRSAGGTTESTPSSRPRRHLLRYHGMFPALKARAIINRSLRDRNILFHTCLAGSPNYPAPCERWVHNHAGGLAVAASKMGVSQKLAVSCDAYCNSSMHFASTSLLGRVTDSGKVASGSSVTFSMSIKLGALALM